MTKGNLASEGKQVRSVLFFVSAIALVTVAVASCKKTPKVDFSETAQDRHEVPSNDQRPALRIAVGAMVSPETTRQYYNDLLSIIAEKAGMRAVFSQRRTYAEINSMVKKKEVDLAFVCSGPYTKGHDEFGMELLVVPIAHGQKVYHSYIITHKDSDLESFDDLKGKRFAFTDPDSNTGCLVPKYMLAKHHETPESYFKSYFYTHSHDNSIKAVAEKQCDGAAVDSLIWKFINTVNPSVTSQTKIIEKSPPYGIPPIVVHPEMNSAMKKTLKEIFLNLHNDEKASELLQHIQIDRFMEGQDSQYDTIRQMEQKLNRKNED